MLKKQMLMVPLVLFAAVVNAADRHEISNLNCSGSWIKKGSDIFDVLAACGEPLAREELSGGGAEVKVETLFYQFKGQKTYIRLKGGVVVAIEVAKR